MKLKKHHVEKPWGRIAIPPAFGPTNGLRIGEVWFESPTPNDNLPLLTKYIFTSERLSIQVHPSDQQARERGLPSGKSECWYILEAEPGATLGLGLKMRVSPSELREAALDGTIEQLMDWRKVTPGDFYHIPPGTIHAIGAGITLLEFQQNADVTYRLFDYGRPRQLHLDDGVAVASIGPYKNSSPSQVDSQENGVLLDTPEFSLARIGCPNELPASFQDRRRWMMPLSGKVLVDDEVACVGDCLLLDPDNCVEFATGTIAVVGMEGPVRSSQSMTYR